MDARHFVVHSRDLVGVMGFPKGIGADSGTGVRPEGD